MEFLKVLFYNHSFFKSILTTYHNHELKPLQVYMPRIHAYIINIGTYRKLKMFWTKNFHPFVNDSLIINYQFFSGKIKQKQFFLREKKLKKNWIFVRSQDHSIKQYNCTLNTLVVSLIWTYVKNQWPEELSRR